MSQETAAPTAVEPTPLPVGRIGFDLQKAVDIQDQVLSAVTGLDRLASLIANAGDELMVRFGRIALAGDKASAKELRREAVAAMTAFPFQDMAGQSVQHSTSRIRAAAEMMGSVVDSDASPPVQLLRRASPVAQRELGAGSAGLF